MSEEVRAHLGTIKEDDQDCGTEAHDDSQSPNNTGDELNRGVS